MHKYKKEDALVLFSGGQDSATSLYWAIKKFNKIYTITFDYGQKHQKEIDAAAELVDFYRYNCYFMAELMKEQPFSPNGLWNRSEYRPLEGYIFAVTPFDFTSIAGNLPTAPAMIGNVSLWKPASSAVYSAYWLMKLFEEAGLAKGVINFVPGSGGQVGTPAMTNPCGFDWKRPHLMERLSWA